MATFVVMMAGTASAAPVVTAQNLTVSHELAAKLATVTCASCHVDASVTRLDVETTDDGTVVSAEINIAISDEHGVMISVLSGGARATTTHASRVNQAQTDALTAAVDGMCPKITGVLQPHHDNWLAAILRTWFVPTRELPTS